MQNRIQKNKINPYSKICKVKKKGEFRITTQVKVIKYLETEYDKAFINTRQDILPFNAKMSWKMF